MPNNVKDSTKGNLGVFDCVDNDMDSDSELKIENDEI